MQKYLMLFLSTEFFGIHKNQVKIIIGAFIEYLTFRILKQFFLFVPSTLSHFFLTYYKLPALQVHTHYLGLLPQT